MDQQRAAYVALALTPGIGPSRIHAILQVCHTATGAFSAPFEFLRSIPGINAAAASAIAAGGVSVGVRVLEETERLGARALIADDPRLPRAAPRDSRSPPPVLFALGDLALLERPAVAIVGSRDHSDYGGEVARALAWGAASAGLVVVSGMARGLDAVAHTAALDSGGATIGVLGNGLGVIYPTANRALYQRVAASGLLLTEFPPGERPTAGSFPRRNRLISGLARVTVVVEAAEGSGALITAGTALDQGREVMVVPGNITSPSSVGANRLIRDGAAPLLSSDDLAGSTTPRRSGRRRGSPIHLPHQAASGGARRRRPRGRRAARHRARGAGRSHRALRPAAAGAAGGALRAGDRRGGGAAAGEGVSDGCDEA